MSLVIVEPNVDISRVALAPRRLDFTIASVTLNWRSDRLDHPNTRVAVQ
jgi:hypothetical protein